MTQIPERLANALHASYRIERELGSGAIATVYLAEDLKHHRQVAVKVLRSGSWTRSLPLCRMRTRKV